MKTLSLLALVLLSSFSAHADSGQSATVRKATQFPFDCRAGKLNYSVEFQEYLVTVDGKILDMNAGADLTVTNEAGKVLNTIHLESGEFEYSLGGPGVGDGYFYSRKARLRLRECLAPAAGAVSIGN